MAGQETTLQKHFISPAELLADAWHLAWQVFESGFRPDHLIGIWRGGTPVAVAVHELLRVLGVDAAHGAVNARSYQGIARRGERVEIDALEAIRDRLRGGDAVLVVDDVYDTGLTLQALVHELRRDRAGSDLDIRIATPWYKPGNNRTGIEPEYYLHRTGDWLVFPHELEGLSLAEIRAHKPELADLLPQLAHRLQQD